MSKIAKLDKCRLNLYLAKFAGVSRRQADLLIRQKKVSVNGEFGQLGQLVSQGDLVKLENRVISSQELKKIFLAVNKPRGVICTTAGQNNNIIQLVKYPIRLFPIGRLDVASTGLIFLTNDGTVVNKILKAQEKVAKEYLVTTEQKISPVQIKRLGQSFVLDNRKTLPALVKLVNPNQVSLVIVEGLNQQIRRMMAEVGLTVKELQRIRIGQFLLKDLKILSGKFKEIDSKEFYTKFKLLT